MIVVLLAFACHAPGEDTRRYIEGINAVDFETGWAACEAIATDNVRGDCLGALTERFHRYDHCDGVPVGRWRDECFFLRAESLGRQGDIEGALRQCKESAFAAQCCDHVLGMVAMAHVSDPADVVAAEITRLRPLLVGPRVEFQFWRSWFRTRMAAGRSLDPTGCGGGCVAAAQIEASALVRELQHARGDAAFCAGPTEYPPWAESPLVRGWVDEQVVRGCSAPPARPDGPRLTPKPVETPSVPG